MVGDGGGGQPAAGRVDGLVAWLRDNVTAPRGAVAALLVLLGVALLLGAGYRSNDIELGHADAWVANSADGEVAHITGPNAEVDLRLTIEGSEGDDMRVLDTDRGVYVHNLTDGYLSRIDPGTFTSDARRPVTPGTDLLVLPADEVVYVVNGEQGRVLAIDPLTLQNVVPPYEDGLTAGRMSGAVDPDGVLWLAQSERGELVSIDPMADTDAGEEQVGDPHDVGEPGDVLGVAIDDGAPGVFNLTAGTWEAPTRGHGPVSLPGVDEDEVLHTPQAGSWPRPSFTAGGSWISFSTGGDEVASPELAEGRELGRPVLDEDRVYVTEPEGGRLFVLAVDDGDVQHSPEVLEGGGEMLLKARDDYAFVTSGDSRDGFVVDPGGTVRSFELDDPDARQVNEEGEVVVPEDDGSDEGGQSGSDESGAIETGLVEQVDPCSTQNPPSFCDPDPVCADGGPPPCGDGDDDGPDGPPPCPEGQVRDGGQCKTPCQEGQSGFVETGCTCDNGQSTANGCLVPCPAPQSGFVETGCRCPAGKVVSGADCLTPCTGGLLGFLETGCRCPGGTVDVGGACKTPCTGQNEEGFVEDGCTCVAGTERIDGVCQVPPPPDPDQSVSASASASASTFARGLLYEPLPPPCPLSYLPDRRSPRA